MQFATRIWQVETWKLEMAVVQQTGSRQTLLFFIKTLVSFYQSGGGR